MADELVLEAQRIVQHAGFAKHDRVLERTPEGQAVLAQHLDVFEEGEGPRRRELLDEGLLGNPQRPRLMPQQRMVVADAVGHLEVLGRVEGDALVAARDHNGSDDLEIFPRRLKTLHTGFLNQVDERRRAAIHDRHFGRVQLDDHIVDAKAHERGQ